MQPFFCHSPNQDSFTLPMKVAQNKTVATYNTYCLKHFQKLEAASSCDAKLKSSKEFNVQTDSMTIRTAGPRMLPSATNQTNIRQFTYNPAQLRYIYFLIHLCVHVFLIITPNFIKIKKKKRIVIQQFLDDSSPSFIRHQDNYTGYDIQLHTVHYCIVPWTYAKEKKNYIYKTVYIYSGK